MSRQTFLRAIQRHNRGRAHLRRQLDLPEERARSARPLRADAVECSGDRKERLVAPIAVDVGTGGARRGPRPTVRAGAT